MATKIGTLQNPEKTEALLPRTCLKAVADKNGDYISEDVLASDINALKDGAIGSLNNALVYVKTETQSVTVNANSDVRIDVADDDYSMVFPHQRTYSSGGQLDLSMTVIRHTSYWFIGIRNPTGSAITFTLDVRCYKTVSIGN